MRLATLFFQPDAPTQPACREVGSWNLPADFSRDGGAEFQFCILFLVNG
jgi:hypothetical protein